MIEKTKRPTWSKIMIIAGLVIGTVIGLILTVLLCVHLFTPFVFRDFFLNAQKEYTIPGLSDGLVPQGYTYVEEKDVYLQCGYMTEDKRGRIYITPAGDEKNSRYVELYTQNGAPYKAHVCGITSANGFLWLACDSDGENNCVWVLSLDEVLSAENGARITLNTRFYPESRAAFCYTDGKYLWVGEFYRENDYETSKNHTFRVSGGENHALICAYVLDSESKIGIASETPELLLSVTDMVQGLARTEEGEFILSTSWGVNKSHLLFYKDVTISLPDAVLDVNGQAVPVYYLDEKSLIKDVEMQPMSEGIFVRDGRVYVLFESASKKYIFGNFMHGRHIYSYNIE